MISGREGEVSLWSGPRPDAPPTLTRPRHLVTANELPAETVEALSEAVLDYLLDAGVTVHKSGE